MNGWGIFSTIRVQDGVMFAWERHWARMHRDAARMRVPFPDNAKWLEERLYCLIEKNQAANSTLRVLIVRNRGGMWEGPSAAERAFDTIALTAPLNDWGESGEARYCAARASCGERVCRDQVPFLVGESDAV